MPFVMDDVSAGQFREEGYCILERVMTEDDLALLRGACQGFIDRKRAEMDAAGSDTIGISHRHKRYFVSRCVETEPRLGRFVFGELMAEICRRTLGPRAYLFYNQYVVKGGGPGSMKFSWHQDSGYVNANGGDTEHAPYLTFWCALDDVSEANGTIYVLPYGRSGIRTSVKHVKDPVTNDWVGYFGPDRGIKVEVPAGSIALFTSYVFHSSGENSTDRLRRVFLAQYSSAPIMRADGSGPWAGAIPFLDGGAQVAAVAP